MKFVLSFVAAALASLAGTTAAAQEYPTRPVRLIVPYPPGGGNDTLARIFGQKIAERWGQQIVVDNRPGAGTTIGTQLAARAAPDGYTILLSSVVTHAFAPRLYAKPGYDPIKDFAPITILGIAPTLFVVNPGLPVRTVQEFIALAKAKPGEIRFASGGNGATPHIAGEVFASLTGIKLSHVPYKGGGPAHVALMSGETQAMFDTAASASPHVRSGKLRAVAIGLPARSPEFPDVPTFAESGLASYNVDSWYSVHAPAGTPKTVIDKWHKEVVNQLGTADMQGRLKTLGANPGGLSPAEFDVYVRKELERYTKIIAQAGVKID